MARDYLSIVKRIEAVYPQAIGTAGGANHDENLRVTLVSYANDLIQEIDQMQRWSYNWSNTNSITTTYQLGTYALPTGVLMVKNLYYVDSAGVRKPLTKYETAELSRVYGDPSSASTPVGIPIRWSLDNRVVTIYPIPNNAGPTSGNYQIFFESYGTTSPIVETTGTTNGSTTLTVPSTSFLTTLGVADGDSVVVRGAGYAQSASVNDDWVTTATTVAASGTTSTLNAAPPTNVTTGQTFFRCQPWVLTYFPKLFEFGMLREVSSYLGADADYQKWEARYQLELQKARELDLDRTMTLEILATAQPGQKDSQFRRSEVFPGFEVRG